MEEFLDIGMQFRREGDRRRRAACGSCRENDGLHSVVELIADRDSPQGTWTLAGGTVHHLAFNTGNEDNQIALKARLEGHGLYRRVANRRTGCTSSRCTCAVARRGAVRAGLDRAGRLGQGRTRRCHRQVAGLPAVVRGPPAEMEAGPGSRRTSDAGGRGHPDPWGRRRTGQGCCASLSTVAARRPRIWRRR